MDLYDQDLSGWGGVMAGDWIKMRTDLWDDPRVVRMAASLATSRTNIIGGLYRIWSLADAYTEDGHLQGYDAEILDSALDLPGFSAALVKVGWLAISDDNLTIPRFEEHNGTSAKRRAMERNRKQRVRSVSACDADKKRPRGRGRGREDVEEDGREPLDVSGAICFSEERRAHARRSFDRIVKSVPCRNRQDFELFAKVALLRELNEISEDDFEECLESVRVNKPDTPGAWLHKCLANKMKKHNESFSRMLATLDLPDWIETFKPEKPNAQHRRQRA